MIQNGFLATQKSQAKPWMAWFLFYAAVLEIIFLAYNTFYSIKSFLSLDEKLGLEFNWQKIYIASGITVLILVGEALYALHMRSKLHKGEFVSSKIFWIMFPIINIVIVHIFNAYFAMQTLPTLYNLSEQL
ncbi:MAG: hypothetical protein AAB482_00450 [Patescibacteria group bacterium]